MNQIIDLTMTLAHGQPGVEFETKYTVQDDGWNARTLHLYSHTGTHMDAPFHFGVSNQTIEEISLKRLLVKGYVIDFPVSEPQTLIPVDVLKPIAKVIKPGEAVLLKTGWSKHFGDPKLYRNGLPRISEALAQKMVELKIGIVGVEPPSIADVNDLHEVTLIHQILLGGDVIIVEGLTNLNAIPAGEFTFGAMPLKIADGDGTPCRAFAMV